MNLHFLNLCFCTFVWAPIYNETGFLPWLLIIVSHPPPPSTTPIQINVTSVGNVLLWRQNQKLISRYTFMHNCTKMRTYVGKGSKTEIWIKTNTAASTSYLMSILYIFGFLRFSFVVYNTIYLFFISSLHKIMFCKNNKNNKIFIYSYIKIHIIQHLNIKCTQAWQLCLVWWVKLKTRMKARLLVPYCFNVA